MTLEDGNLFTASTFGSDTYEYKNNSAEEFSLYLGTNNGIVDSFRIHSNGTVVENEAVRFEGAFEGPIRGLFLEDCCNGGKRSVGTR